MLGSSSVNVSLSSCSCRTGTTAAGTDSPSPRCGWATSRRRCRAPSRTQCRAAVPLRRITDRLCSRIDWNELCTETGSGYSYTGSIYYIYCYTPIVGTDPPSQIVDVNTMKILSRSLHHPAEDQCQREPQLRGGQTCNRC